MKTRIVLGVTGGIAAYKSAELCSLMVKNGFEVRVIMSENATKFVTPLTFQTLSKNAVTSSLFDLESWKPEHINLASWGEIFVVAPATANFLGKLTHGIADDAISTFAISTNAPIIIAPAMNPQMWRNSSVEKNYITLSSRPNITFVGPTFGHVACGEDGIGRMAQISDIFAEVINHAQL